MTVADSTHALCPLVGEVEKNGNVGLGGGCSEPRSQAPELFADPLKGFSGWIHDAVESLDKRWAMFFVAGQRATPFEIEIAMASVREVHIGLQAQSFVGSDGRNISSLFRAKETLLGPRAAGEIIKEAGGVLPMRLAYAGSTDVVVPGGGIQKFRCGGEDVDRPGRARPVGEDKLTFGICMEYGRLPAQIIQKLIGVKATIVEADGRLPATFSRVAGEMNLRPFRIFIAPEGAVPGTIQFLQGAIAFFEPELKCLFQRPDRNSESGKPGSLSNCHPMTPGL